MQKKKIPVVHFHCGFKVGIPYQFPLESIANCCGVVHHFPFSRSRSTFRKKQGGTSEQIVHIVSFQRRNTLATIEPWLHTNKLTHADAWTFYTVVAIAEEQFLSRKYNRLIAAVKVQNWPVPQLLIYHKPDNRWRIHLIPDTESVAGKIQQMRFTKDDWFIFLKEC